jgi:hypothetical protein
VLWACMTRALGLHDAALANGTLFRLRRARLDLAQTAGSRASV